MYKGPPACGMKCSIRGTYVAKTLNAQLSDCNCNGDLRTAAKRSPRRLNIVIKGQSLSVSLGDAVALPQFDKRDTKYAEKGSRLTLANEWPVAFQFS